MTDVDKIVQALNLEPHPEGGWYRETWREQTDSGSRAHATAIYYLMAAGQRSRWHQVDAAELWLWHAGHPLTLDIAEAGAPVSVPLGPDVFAGQRPQRLIPRFAWQAAHAAEGWALVSCVVAPGFEFSGFVMADPGWTPANGSSAPSPGTMRA